MIPKHIIYLACLRTLSAAASSLWPKKLQSSLEQFGLWSFLSGTKYKIVYTLISAKCLSLIVYVSLLFHCYVKLLNTHSSLFSVLVCKSTAELSRLLRFLNWLPDLTTLFYVALDNPEVSSGFLVIFHADATARVLNPGYLNPTGGTGIKWLGVWDWISEHV